MHTRPTLTAFACVLLIACSSDTLDPPDPWDLQNGLPEVDSATPPEDDGVRGLLWSRGRELFFYPEGTLSVDDPATSCGTSTSIPRNSVVGWKVTGSWRPEGLRRFVQGSWRQTSPEEPTWSWWLDDAAWQVTDERIVAATLHGSLDTQTLEFEVTEGTTEVCGTLRYVGGCLIPEDGDVCAWVHDTTSDDPGKVYSDARQGLPTVEDLPTGAIRIALSGDTTLDRTLDDPDSDHALRVNLSSVWFGEDAVREGSNATQPSYRWMFTFEGHSWPGPDADPEHPITLSYLSDMGSIPSTSYAMDSGRSWVSSSTYEPDLVLTHFSLLGTNPDDPNQRVLVWGGRTDTSF